MQGPEAVQAFYIISGFYMALILNEKYIDLNAYLLFISNRFLKLFPVYWIVLLLVLITSFAAYVFAGNWFGLQAYQTTNMSWSTSIYLFLSNIFIIGQDVSLFLGLNSTSGGLYFTENFAGSQPQVNTLMLVPQAWTISIEIMFYLIAPFIVRKKLWWILLVFLCAAALKLFLLTSGFNYDPWSYRFFPAELMYFFMGVLSYNLYVFLINIRLPSWLLPVSLYSTLIVIFLYSYLHNYIKTYAFFPCLALAIPFIFIYTKNSLADRKIGELSYPIYISHVFIKGLVFFVIGYRENVSIPVAIGSIVFGWFVNEFVLKRIETYRQGRIRFLPS